MRREQLILPPLTAFEVTIFRNEPLPYPAIYKVHIIIQLQVKSNLCNLSFNILHLFRCKIKIHIFGKQIIKNDHILICSLAKLN